MDQEEWLFIGPGEGSRQSEVFSLPLGNATCDLAIDPLPELMEHEGAYGALLDGLVTVCNVYWNFQQDNKTHCFSLDPVLGTWFESTEPLQAFGAAAISLPNGDMMIMEAGDEHSLHTRTFLYSLEINTWTDGPEMPGPRYDV